MTPSGMSDPIERIEAALAKLGNEYEPPAGWEDRVLAATRAPVAKPAYMRRMFLIVPPVLALASVMVWLFLFHTSSETEPAFAVALRIDRKTVMRGAGSGGAIGGASTGSGGDVAYASGTGRGHRVLRVYHRDNLVLACVATPDGTVLQEVSPPAAEGNTRCMGTRDTLAVSWVLQGTGDYKLLGLASLDKPIPPTLHNFNRDQGALIDADLLRLAAVRDFNVE